MSSTTGVSGLSSTEEEEDEHNDDEVGPYPWLLWMASVDEVRVVVVVENPSTRIMAGKEAHTPTTTTPNTSRPNNNDNADDDSGGPILMRGWMYIQFVAFPVSCFFGLVMCN